MNYRIDKFCALSVVGGLSYLMTTESKHPKNCAISERLWPSRLVTCQIFRLEHLQDVHVDFLFSCK